MHAFLTIGGNTLARTNDMLRRIDIQGIASYDRITLSSYDKPSVGVSDIRAFIHQLYFCSHGKNGTAGIIEDAAQLTQEAQQALLKTVEEPPPHVQLYIGAASETQVLPTIASRCQIMRLASNEAPFTPNEMAACTTLIQTIVVASPGKRLMHIQSIGKTRDDAKRWIDYAIIASWSKKHDTTLMHALFEAKRLSDNNVNPFQLLEHIFLTIVI